MNRLNKTIKAFFFIALALSIGFPTGILCIIFGAINSIIPLLVTGIILTVAGFYVMPFIWVAFGIKLQYKRLLTIILNEQILNVNDLADHTGYTHKQVREMIGKAIILNYLTGYIFKQDTLTVNTKNKEQHKNFNKSTTKHTKKCGNCGALMVFDGEKFACDYCGITEIN